MSSYVLKLYEKLKVKINSSFVYPSLNSYQQLELLKVLMHGRWVEFARWFPDDYYAGEINFKNRIRTESFEETLSGMLLLCYDSFNDKDKERVKKILGGLQ